MLQIGLVLPEHMRRTNELLWRGQLVLSIDQGEELSSEDDGEWMRPPPTDSESEYSTIEDPTLTLRLCWPGMGAGGLPSSDEGVDASGVQQPPAPAAGRVPLIVNTDESDTREYTLCLTWREEESAPAPKRRRRRGGAAAPPTTEEGVSSGAGAAVEMRGRMSVDTGHSLPLSLGGEVREGSCIG